MSKPPDNAARSAVLELDDLHWATQKNAVEAKLSRRPGVLAVVANPAAQTATVTYDPAITTVAELAGWIRDCGYHCRGESVPNHVCAPAVASGNPAPASMELPEHQGHGGHDLAAMAPMTPAPASAERIGSPADVMGHGGHGEMSMAGMARDMRNRFLVAVVFGVVITLWSMIGREVLNFSVPAPFGLRDDVFQLMLSLPVIFYSAQVFFAGAFRAFRALRARTLDMMVLVAVAVEPGGCTRWASPSPVRLGNSQRSRVNAGSPMIALAPTDQLRRLALPFGTGFGQDRAVDQPAGHGRIADQLAAKFVVDDVSGYLRLCVGTEHVADAKRAIQERTSRAIASEASLSLTSASCPPSRAASTTQ